MMANSKDDEVFDPFGLHVEVEDYPDPEPQLPPTVTRFLGDNQEEEEEEEPPTFALPPKLVVNFVLVEEVSSMAKVGAENSGISEVFTKGYLSAHVTSSDALKNAPFCLTATCEDLHNEIHFEPHENGYASVPATSMPPDGLSLVHIPKTHITAMPIGSFTTSEEVRHMPILVERKITMYATNVKVAIQVRSKLSNRGDLRDFLITIAVPERVNGETVEVLRGNGSYDSMKRTIRYSLQHLPKGESFMVSAQAQLWSKAEPDELPPRFPALLKCESDNDQISSVEIVAVPAEGFPATIACSTARSFRLLHRLT